MYQIKDYQLKIQNLLTSLEPKKSKVKFALNNDSTNIDPTTADLPKVGSIPYEQSHTQSRPVLNLMAMDSLSMQGNVHHHHNADVSVSINGADLHHQHNNTSSIQYHHRNLSSKATSSINNLLTETNSNNHKSTESHTHRQQNSNLIY